MGAVTLYHNASDNRVLYKNLTTKVTLSNVKFKDDSSIMEPTLIISSTSSANIFASNYCKIEDFGNRYYYITDISVSQQYIIVKCKVDPLSSFASEVLNMRGYIKRTNKIDKNKGRNSYINDKKYVITNNKFPAVRNFSKIPLGYDGPNGWVLVTACANTDIPS